jgi:hypothetical protein
MRFRKRKILWVSNSVTDQESSFPEINHHTISNPEAFAASVQGEIVVGFLIHVSDRSIFEMMDF